MGVFANLTDNASPSPSGKGVFSRLNAGSSSGVFQQINQEQAQQTQQDLNDIQQKFGVTPQWDITKSPLMQKVQQFEAAPSQEAPPQPPSAWNGVLDNPIVHGAETALQWAQKPFESVSTGLADAAGALNNLFGTHTVKDFSGQDITLTPSQQRNALNDVKNIWSQTNENVPAEAWQGAEPNLGKIPGTDVNWTDAINMAAQSISPGELVKPLSVLGDIAKERPLNSFVKGIESAPLPIDTTGRITQDMGPLNTQQANTLADNFARQEQLDQLKNTNVEAPPVPEPVNLQKDLNTPSEPVNLDELVKANGYPEATPESIAQTYNNKTWYHGTGTDKLTAESLDPFVGNHESLFGQGIYLTDNPDIATGYANSRGKRGTPTTYEANVNTNRILDLEKPTTPDVAEALDKTAKPLDYQYEQHMGEKNHFTNLIKQGVKEGHTPEQIITDLRNEVRDFSHEAEIPTSEFVDNFQDLAVNLKNAGYDGITHTGGSRTGNKPHRVLIMLDPKGAYSDITHPNQITRFEKYTGSKASNVPKTMGDLDKKIDYQKEYEQAVKDQYDYLKQSMKERAGVDQGNVIKDQNGDVIDRYGRISQNPEWYQDFYKEHGRTPTNQDLMELAKKHVDEGFQTEVGRAPSFRPNDLQEIETQLNEIRAALPHVEGEAKQSLEQTAATLEKERQRLKTLLPEGVHAYAGNHIPFRQAAAQSGKTISRTDVINNMRKNLGVTIDTGRLSSKGRGVLGEYKVSPEVIRSRMSQDIQVISHEIGHHLDKKFNLQNPQYQSELDRLMVATGHNTSAYSAAQLPAEGIAEYVRLRLTDPSEATRLAPNFEKYFNSKLDKKTLEGLVKTQKDIDTWITQGAYEQAKGLLDFTGGEKGKKFNYDKWYTQFVDDLNPLKLMEKALNGAIGIGRESIYKMARLSRGISARAELAVTHGIYDDTGHKISDGLAEIVAPLKAIGMKDKDFATYLAVKHAEDLKKLNKKVPFDDQQIKAVLQKWDNNPVVQKAQQGIVKFNNALTDILVEAQILSKQAVSEMRTKYPNYVPFMRYFDDDAVAGFKNGGFGAAKGFANIANPIKRMSEEGSLRTIVNPVESMVKNAFLVMNAAAKNKVGLQLADLSKIEGAGAWVEHIGEGGSSPHEHIVSVYENGTRNSYKMRNPDLYNAMLSLDAESTNSLIRFLGGAASALRGGATLTPDFMVRNMMRDVIGNTVNATKYGFNPLTIFKGLFHMVAPQMLGKNKLLDAALTKMGADRNIFDQFISSGGAMGTMMSLDRDMNREALKKVFRKSMRVKAMHVVTSPKELAKFLSGYTPIKAAVHTLRKGSEISELATRLGSFNKVLKKTGSAEEAAYTARDLMDFNRAGTSIRQANRAIAFLNANIQGVDRMARAFKDNPASFLVRAFTTLVLPAATVYYWNHNLPPEQKAAYDNIPQWQKDSFFVVGVPGSGLFLRIPKPFEAGMLFATGTERTLRWLQDHDPNAFKDYGQSVFGALTPPMLMTALTPLLEGITNYSFFKNAPIIPQGDQRLEKKDQYGIFTSETAKLIGKLLSKTPLADSNFASPRIIDNTIKGYTAGLGNYAVQGADSLIKQFDGKQHVPLPAKKPSEQPFAQSFFASTAGGGQIRQDFYDKWDQLSQAKASAARNDQPFQDPDYNRMKAADSAITKLNKLYKQVQSSQTMDPQTKRAKLDQLDAQMNHYAAKGLGR